MGDTGHIVTPSDEDKTILRPVPGGRKRTVSPTPQPLPQGLPPNMELPVQISSGASPLVEISLSVLSLVPSLRNMAQCPNINMVQARFSDAIKKAENQMGEHSFSPTQARTASYFLCTLIDETVLNTPWGSESGWGHNSLLIQFHNEAWGGEKFFAIVQHLVQHPATNLPLLELAYLCLCLGFMGKYRLDGNGLRQIEGLRQELYLIIQRSKSGTEPELSLFWRGLGAVRSPLAQQLPWWVCVPVVAVLLMAAYLGFTYAINRSSNHVFEKMSAIALEEAKRPSLKPEAPPPPPRPEILSRADRFKTLLAPEIQEHKVEVADGNLLRILNAFPSGSAQLKDEYRPMIEKIAKEVNDGSSRIAVVGHTDATPIFSARFPSNWHLSQERAKNVADMLLVFAPLQERLSSEGRAATEPIDSNDNAEGRARNRRIEIRIR